jgi:phosphopentomutase
MSVFLTIILDGVGIGAQPDADEYGDVGSDTLGHVCETASPELPNMRDLGIGNIRPLSGIVPSSKPEACFGRLTETSAGKDSTTGHWELAGVDLEDPFPTYPDGFPQSLLDSFMAVSGCTGVLGNRAASGTAIVTELGARHQDTGYPIVYTSADSVFQIAAHVDTIPLDDLYLMCEVAREKVCVGEHGVGRVIARPFEGSPGSYKRISAGRKDFSLKPTGLTVQEVVRAGGVTTVSIGKIYDLFGGVGFDESHKTRSNDDGLKTLIERLNQAASIRENAFIWINMVDFDQEFGHRNNPVGFASALEAFDMAVPQILGALPEESRLLITADHGNDPTTVSTDHSREYVPLLYWGSEPGRDLGTRKTFKDHAATVCSYFGLNERFGGQAFE